MGSHQILNEKREYKNLKGVIEEELGISEEVKILANKITDKIVSEYYPGYELKITPFSKKCGEYTISLIFTDYPKKSMALKSCAEFKGITYFSNRKIIIYGYTVKGNIPKDEFAEVLQHELKHVFDLYKSQRSGFFNTNKESEIYRIAATQATNKNLPDELRAIGYAVYLSHDFESQAFESGTYAYLMKQDLSFMGDEMKAVKNTMYYKRLLFVRYAYDFVNADEETARHIAESIYGKTLNWLKKTITMSLKMTRRQIGRAVAKVRNDYDWTHDGNSSVWV